MDMDFGSNLGSPKGLQGSVRRIPNFTGTNYGTLDTPKVFTGDFEVDVEYSSTETDLLNMAVLGDSVSAGAVNYLQLEQTGGYARFLTLDGSVSWLHNNEHRDRKIHIIKTYREGNTIGIKLDGVIKVAVTLGAASTVTLDVIGGLAVSGTPSQFFKGQILSTKFTDKSGAEDVVTNYVFDSGSTVEQYARGSTTDKINWTNFTAANWSRFTLQRNILHKTGVVAEGWLGDNVVVNGRFSADTDWTKGAGWSIANGVASCDGTISNLISSTAFSLPVGSIVLGGITIKDISAADILVSINGTGGGDSPNLSSNGVHSFIGFGPTTAVSTFLTIYSQTPGFIGSIDNVSVQHLLEVAQ